MFKNYSLLLLLSIFMIKSFAQERQVCGTSKEALQIIQNRLLENKKTLTRQGRETAKRNQEDIYIPVKFHLVARDNGGGRVPESDIFDQLCTMNEVFRELNLQFYIKDGFNLVNSSRIYDSPTILSVEGEMNAIRDQDAVNIYVVRDVQNPLNEGIGTTLGYYNPKRDWVVVERTETNKGGMTLLHELGHFFSLPHPFNGWDTDPFNDNRAGSPAPEVSPGGIPSEYADGSNCETAGDMICDTPADYLYFDQINYNACKYNKPMIDPKGDTLHPDPTLIMGYFSDNCMERFTPMQVALMATDYESEHRAYLRNSNFTPMVTPISSTPVNLFFPEDDSVVSSTGEIRLEWEAVAGARFYQVEIFPTGTTSFAITTTEPAASIQVIFGTSYRWRIKPYNDTYTCAPYSELRTFRADMASAVQGIQNVQTWSIQPNPNDHTNPINLTIVANEAFDANLQIVNLAGQVVQDLPNQTFKTGMNHQLIAINDLISGLYFVVIDNGKGTLHQKLVVH